MLAPTAYLDLIGRPFVRGARGPEAYDCYGLILEMNRREGLELPDFHSPDTVRDVADIVSREIGRWTITGKHEPGATFLFRIEGVGAHVGYHLGGGNFIHADEQSGVMVERISRAPWADRFIQAYRYEA